MSYKFRRAVTTALLSLALVGGVALGSVATASEATAATNKVVTATKYHGKTLKVKVGKTEKRVYFGTYKLGKPYNFTGFCIDPGNGLANAKGISTIKGKIPGASVANSPDIKYLASKYDTTTSNTTAMRAHIAIRLLLGDISLKHIKGLSSSDVAGIKGFLAEAKKHGPYNVHLTATPVLQGQDGTGTVTVKSASGSTPPSGGKLSMSASNAKVTKVAGSLTSGTVSYKFTRTGSGKVTIKAKVTYPDSTEVKVNKRTSSRQQRLIGGGNKSYSGMVSFDLKVHGPKVTSTCDTDCDGTAVIKVEQCAPAGVGGINLSVLVNGKTASGGVVSAGNCKTFTFAAHDADVITSQYCAVNDSGKCVSAWVKNPGSFEVECPAWASATINVGCNCSKGWASVVFDAPVSPRRYTGTVVLSNANGVLGRIPVDLVNGQSVKVPISLNLEPGVVITAQFSAYASSGKKLVDNKTLVAVQIVSLATDKSGDRSFKVKTTKDTANGTVKVDGKTVTK